MGLVLIAMEKENENKEGIYLTESNVLDVYKKLVDKTSIASEEIEQVKKRFWELVNYKPGGGQIQCADANDDGKR